MLVLSRKQGERLHIGDDITISVLEVQGRRIRIGIEAPSHVRVVRGELREWNRAGAKRRSDRRTLVAAG
jgi:carbon storage regulator